MSTVTPQNPSPPNRTTFPTGLNIPAPFPPSALEAARIYQEQGLVVIPPHPPGTGPGKQVGTILDAQVTTYPDAMSPDKPAVNTLAAALDAIQAGHFRAQIEELRRIRARDGKAVYDREKTRLPAFTASGTTRDRKKIDRPSGFLQLDFDRLGADLTAARQNVMRDPHVAAAFISPSGDGLKVLVRVPPGPHNIIVKEAARYFLEYYGLKNDPQVKEPTRLCFVSWDPDLHRNPNATVLPLPEDDGDEPDARRGRPKKAPPWWTAFKGDLTTLDLLALFRQAERLGECLDPDTGKHAVRCPWSEEHGNGGTNWKTNASDTVIFTEGRWPAFKCLHAHCVDRTLKDVCQWFEDQYPGTIDKHCGRLRGEFAGEALANASLQSPWGEPTEGAQQSLEEEFGEPFPSELSQHGEIKITDFNCHYWTAQFAFENLILYEPNATQFYIYVPDCGLWRWATEEAIQSMLAAYLLNYSRVLNQPILERKRSQQRLRAMASALKAQAERREPFFRSGQVIHLANGMLHLDTHPPEFREFSPHYFSVNQCPVSFDPDAGCPRFLKELVHAALDPDDARLLQTIGGLFLSGRNSWHKVVVFVGRAGTRKSTAVRILECLIGRENVKHLRTELLGQRFELDDLAEKTLLVGSDVGADFLKCDGAQIVKSLSGGDPLAMEQKGGRKRTVRGEHNILITTNEHLQVNVNTDAGAWKRRLVVIMFNRPPRCQITDFDEVLMREEGSGILNWFLLGAVRLYNAPPNTDPFSLTATQQERVEHLLGGGNSLRTFIRTSVGRNPGDSLTTEEIRAAYTTHCANQGQECLPRRDFDTHLPRLMEEFHQASKRNDLRRGKAAKRGFMNVRLLETPQ